MPGAGCRATFIKPRTWTTMKAAGDQSFRDGKRINVNRDLTPSTPAPASTPAQAPASTPARAPTSASPPASSEIPRATPKAATAAPVTVSGSTDADAAIKAVYVHMFGEESPFKPGRGNLDAAEDALRAGTVTVKGFVKEVVKSPMYKRRYFHQRSIFSYLMGLMGHVLGRKPDGVDDDYRRWVRVYDQLGYDAMVDALMDDGEYDKTFGNNTVPHARGNSASVTGADAYEGTNQPVKPRIQSPIKDMSKAGAPLAFASIVLASLLGTLIVASSR